MNDEYIKGYREGYMNAIDTKQNMKYQMFGLDLGKVLEIVSEHMQKGQRRKVIDVIDCVDVIIKRNGKVVYED